MLIVAGRINGQVSYPGEPASFFYALSEINQQYIYEFPAVDLDALKREDKITDKVKDIPFRFGVSLDAGFDLSNAWQYDVLPDGNKVWRLAVRSAGAKTLNFNFDKYWLPDGASLFIYSPVHGELMGAFTAENNKYDSSFATFILKGDVAILEYNEPGSAEFSGLLSLGSVVHGYRAFDKQGSGFGDAGSCNVGINCPEGLDWQNEKRSVVLILTASNTSICSGALVNNSREDGRPYILTANHCRLGTNNIFAFNYDSPDCSPQTNPSVTQTMNGCIIRAHNASNMASDFMLVELLSKPPITYNVFYSGWSNLDQAPDRTVCIHHPSGDVKKISVDNNYAENSGYYGQGDDHWMIVDWDLGTTEDGSSGSPLFNAQHRIVGQLHGGDAFCNLDEPDYFGKFSYSWQTESDTAKQLKYWLDPDNTGINVLDGYDPVIPLPTNDVQLAGISGNFDNIICMDSIYPELMIKNKGTATLTSLRVIYIIDGQKDTIDWVGSLGTNQLMKIVISPIPVTTGKHYFAAVCANPNQGVDQNLSNNSLSFLFFSVESPKEVEFVLKTDDYGNETSWELRNAAGTLVQLGGGYPRITGGATYTESLCLYDGCYRFTIYDSYNDGICCSNGAGYYLLRKVVNGDTIKINTKFMTGKESTEFCVGDSCTILVDARIWPVSEINASDGNIQLNMVAGNPPFTYNWTNGKITKDIYDLPIGTYGVTVTDSLGCSAYFTFNVSLSTGVESVQLAGDEGLSVYPNPSNGIFNVRADDRFVSKGAILRVYDLTGSQVYESKLSGTTTELDLQDLRRGMYVLSLTVEGQQLHRKIILN